MSKIFLLIGKAAVGKDTFKNYLLTNGNFHNAISYTTRPVRPNEQQDVDYHFISDKEMDDIINKGLALETTEYPQADGSIFRYCYAKTCFDMEKDNLMIINPIGLKQLAQYPEIKSRMVVLYLSVGDTIRQARYIERELAEKSNLGNILERWYTRLKRDNLDFQNLVNFMNESQIPFHSITGTIENAKKMIEEGMEEL